MLHAMERDAQQFCYDAGGSEFGNGSHGTTRFLSGGNKYPSERARDIHVDAEILDKYRLK